MRRGGQLHRLLLLKGRLAHDLIDKAQDRKKLLPHPLVTELLGVSLALRLGFPAAALRRLSLVAGTTRAATISLLTALGPCGCGCRSECLVSVTPAICTVSRPCRRPALMTACKPLTAAASVDSKARARVVSRSVASPERFADMPVKKLPNLGF